VEPSEEPSDTDENLPKTGESSTILFSVIGFLLVSIGLVLRRKLIKH
jgi:LPXTG-motif cell wall-anchored protein